MRLIDADELLKVLRKYKEDFVGDPNDDCQPIGKIMGWSVAACIEAVEFQPTIDDAPIAHGK